MEFFEALKNRRTYYFISGKSTISDEEIIKIAENALLCAPTAFNSQSVRVAVLFGENHNKLWSIVKETLRKIVPPDNFAGTEAKINSFDAGYATVLFFDDTEITKGLQEKFPSYKDNFPIWAQQSNGMAQLIIWSALEAEGLGVNIQHYNPIIDDEVKEVFDFPKSWQLVAQMPFGLPTAGPDAKSVVPASERIRVLK